MEDNGIQHHELWPGQCSVVKCGRAPEAPNIRCVKIQVCSSLSGALKFCLIPRSEMNCHQLCAETLVALSEILQAPPPSVMMQWIPIGSGELKVSYTIARLTTWIDDLNEYDEKKGSDI